MKEKKYLLIFFTLPVVIIIMFLFDGFIPLGIQLQRSDWLVFWGATLGYVGTIILGWLAIKQNRKTNTLNDEWQARFIELNKKSLELSQHLIEIEEERQTPYITIDEQSDLCVYLYPEKNQQHQQLRTNEVLSFEGSINESNGTIPVKLCSFEINIKNVSKTNIKSLSIMNFFAAINGTSLKVNYGRSSRFSSLLIGEQKKILYIVQKYYDREIDNNEENLVNLDGRSLPIVNLQVVFELRDFVGNKYEEKVHISCPSLRQVTGWDNVYYAKLSQMIEHVKKTK